jgi:threonine aldolase
LNKLKINNIHALPFSKTKIRFVTHLHITDNDVNDLEKCLKSIS